jgi:hypothetical protein
LPSQAGKHQENNAPRPVRPGSSSFQGLPDALFAELRKYDIPQNLLDAVEDFGPQVAVTWLNERGMPAGPDDAAVEPVIAKPGTKSPETMSRPRSWARDRFVELWQGGPPKRAGDALAECLRSQLKQTRSETVPVRSKKLLAPSIIARVAVDMLYEYAVLDQPPGLELIELFRELLRVDKRRLEGDRQLEAREEAVRILAEKPDIGTRELARLVKVDASSVSRWRKDGSFSAEIEFQKNLNRNLRKHGLWPGYESNIDKKFLQKLSHLSDKLKDAQRLKDSGHKIEAVGNEFATICEAIKLLSTVFGQKE